MISGETPAEKKTKSEDETFPQVTEDSDRDVAILAKTAELEKTAKASRGVSSRVAIETLRLLADMGHATIQAEGEADGLIASLSSQYDYVVADDGDFIIHGANNMLKNYGKTNEVFVSADI